MKHMMLIFAHPDDESFSVAGTVAKYAKGGWNITLVIATNGEKGESGEYGDIGEVRLAEIRKQEVQNAANILGIKQVQFLNLPDFGLKNLTPGTLEDPIHGIMRELLPDIVITHDPTGMTNHPDHIKVSYAVTYAFQKYAAYLTHLSTVGVAPTGRGKVWKQGELERAFGDTLVFEKEPKLYYTCIPRSAVEYLMREKQIPEESFGLPWKGTPDKQITTVIDITPTQLDKGKALLAHVSQTTDVDRFISFANHPGVKNEYFQLRMQGVYEVYMGKSDRVAGAL